MGRQGNRDLWGKPNFRIYDAPMSAVDIESLSEFKRDIVGTFVETMKEADPGTPFAKFGAPSTSDEDIDMIWRVYVIPELLKQDSVMPIEELPFDIDPVKQEFIRNYSDYLALKKLGISDSGMSQEDFDRAAQELLVESPAKTLTILLEKSTKLTTCLKQQANSLVSSLMRI